MSTYTENKDNHYETKDSAQGKNHILLEITLVPHTTPCTLLRKTAYSSIFQSLLLAIQECKYYSSPYSAKG